MSVPEISIVVPVYKGARTLRMAVESVRAQTFADWECILVDDGSQDGSGAVADQLVLADPRIRVIHQANGGTSVARNTGLAAARGTYVAFLDEDDAYHPRFLETLHRVAETHRGDVVGCDFLPFADTASPDWSGSEEVGEETVADREGIRRLVARFYYGVPFEVWRNLYRRELLAGHAFVPGVRVEQDLLWHYTLLPRVGVYVQIPWKGYAWRESATGGYLHPDPSSLVSLLTTYRTILDEVVPALALSGDLRRDLSRAMITDIRWNVWRHLTEGLRLGRADSRRLRQRIRDLDDRGVSLCDCLAFSRRLKWRLFMLTGLTFWTRI